MLSEETRRSLLSFCTGETDALAFEAWVNTHDEVEGQIGHGMYLELISADYRGRDVAAVRDLCARLLDQHHPGNLRRYRIRSIVRGMIEDPLAVVPGLQGLVRLWHEGCDDVPIEFVGFDSEMDGVPTPEHYHRWEQAFLAELLVRKAPYVKSIQQVCEELLHDLKQRFPDDV